jgi:hypothetical protein
MSYYEKLPNNDRSSVDIFETSGNSTSGDEKEEAPLLDEPLDSDEQYGRRDVVETKEKSPARIAFSPALESCSARHLLCVSIHNRSLRCSMRAKDVGV